MSKLKAYISNIQRFCVHDGPGIRTVAFFLGCPLSCKWCQNPETIRKEPQLMMNHELCARCGACIEKCSRKAITMNETGEVVTDRTLCEECFECVGECYFDARTVSGTLYTVENLYHEIIKDMEFFTQSGGGITLSGGEPTLCADFSAELLRRLKGIHRAIETCGYTKWEEFEKLLPVTDLFLYDMKCFDEEKHKTWTGTSNQIIRENLEKLICRHKEVILRIPLVPGVNDEEKEFSNMMAFAHSLGGISEVHILPFHQIGSSKYGILGKEYDLAELKEENEKGIARCKDIAKAAGFRVSIGGAGF